MKHTNHTYFYTYSVCNLENNLFSPSLLKAHYSAFNLGFTVHLSPHKKFFCFSFGHETACKILIPKVIIPAFFNNPYSPPF